MTGTTPRLPDGVAVVRERERDVGVPLYPVPGWAHRFPWLAHGTTGTGLGDMGWFGETPAAEVRRRWRTLRSALGMPRAVHSRQVHGGVVHGDTEGHGGTEVAGVFIGSGQDGHVTGRAGVLLTVALADCVPIFLVDPGPRRVALVHGGWRGTAAGIVAAGLDALGAAPGAVVAHLGPAICGRCYEVGPEVHEALGLPAPATNSPVDLRAAQAQRLVEGGVEPDRITVSERCTKHDGGFFSHRGGSAGRQIGLLGVRR